MKGFRFTSSGRFINVRNPYSYNQKKLFEVIGTFLIDCFMALSKQYHKDDLYCPYNNLNKKKFIGRINDYIPLV